jgi:hypothetical protein
LVKDPKRGRGIRYNSLTEFNDFHYEIYKGIDIKEAPNYQMIPRGNTALYDAIGKTIKNTGYRLRDMEEADKPSKVLFVIQTDGEENCSRYYTLSDIQEMIKHQQEKYSWEFIFLGANIDAVSIGGLLGIREENAMTYRPDFMGVGALYSSLSSVTASYRKGGAVRFSARDRALQD